MGDFKKITHGLESLWSSCHYQNFYLWNVMSTGIVIHWMQM